jgi:hypothetical protein
LAPLAHRISLENPEVQPRHAPKLENALKDVLDMSLSIKWVIYL